MLTKEQIRKNREKVRMGMQGCLVTLSQNCPFPSNILATLENAVKKQDGDDLNRRRRDSEDLSLLDKENRVKEIYLTQGFNDLFEIKESLGQGTQSVVYKCIERETKELYAAKMIRTSEPELTGMLKEQYKILRSLDHFAVTKAKYLFINEKEASCHMVCEYYPFGNLREFFMKKGRCKEAEVAEIISIVLNGLAYIHKKGVAHRDIKPENIMYDPIDKTLKIIDFEISKVKKYKHERLQMLTNTGTIYYKAPQMFTGGYYNEQVDIWAVGVMAYELLRGQLPFMSRYEAQNAKLICEAEPDFNPAYFTPHCLDFLRKCLQKDPLKRMTAQGALRSPFLLKHSGSSTISSPKMTRASSYTFDLIDSVVDFSTNCLEENTTIFKNLDSDHRLGIRQIA